MTLFRPRAILRGVSLLCGRVIGQIVDNLRRVESIGDCTSLWICLVTELFAFLSALLSQIGALDAVGCPRLGDMTIAMAHFHHDAFDCVFPLLCLSVERV
mmetsp:Transcript_1318/g.2121  ORF Transcript_1318/g.2121 Transcript_1318/m.2121 type:complete len:100 (-) Transcript_1318:179-478(-)